MRKTFLTMTALSALVLISPALHDTAAAGPGFKPAIRIKPQIKVKIDRTRLTGPKQQVKIAKVPAFVPADTKPRKPLKTANVPAIAPDTKKAEPLPEQHAAPSVVSAPLPRSRPQIANDGTDKDPNFGGIDVAALLLLRPDRPGAGDAPDKGGKAGDGSISDLLGLNGPDDRAGSADGGWDPLASADDLGGSSWDPLAGIDGLDDTLWDPLGGVDDGTGSAGGGWDPLGGLDDALGDDYDWQNGFRDDRGWAMAGGDRDNYHEFGLSPAADAMMEEANWSLEFVFMKDEALVADDVTEATATEADKAEAKMWAAVDTVASIGEAAVDAMHVAAECLQGLENACIDDDEPTTDGGDSTPVPIEVDDMGGGVPTDAAGNPIAPDLDRGDVDPAPEVDDPAAGRVITDAKGNPFDPNIHGGDIDPAPDADSDSSAGTIDQGQIGGDIDWDYET